MVLPQTLVLVGDICSGKDYIGAVLAARCGFETLGVGPMIAAEIEVMEGLPSGTIYGSNETKDKYRTRLQDHGNNRRAEDPDYWVKAWWAARARMGGKIVMTSGRFIREARFAMLNSAVVVKVVLPETVRLARIAKIYPNHPAAAHKNPAECQIHEVPYHFQLFGTTPSAVIPSVLAQAYSAWNVAGCPVIEPPVLAANRVVWPQHGSWCVDTRVPPYPHGMQEHGPWCLDVRIPTPRFTKEPEDSYSSRQVAGG